MDRKFRECFYDVKNALCCKMNFRQGERVRKMLSETNVSFSYNESHQRKTIEHNLLISEGSKFQAVVLKRC